MSYIKLATNNKNDINNSIINYCIFCYGVTKNISKCEINICNIYWINDKEGFTGGCKKCSIDAVIPGNYFKNILDDNIEKQLAIWFKEGFE
jgi:hypothetical protein